MMDRKVEMFSVEGKTIEYSIVGEGIPILIMHGGHSNCYEEFGYSALIKQGFSLITPSRAGYGKTSKDIGGSISSACEFYLKLLNHLNLEKIHLIAISAGGPSGIYFTSRYPERVKTLTLQCAVTKEWLTPEDRTYKIAQILFRPAVESYIWKLVSFMNNLFPRYMFKQMTSSFSKLPYGDVATKMNKEDIEEIRKMNNRQKSGYGFLIDLSQTAMISSDELQVISCPTLIIHSQNDGAVPIDHAYHANKHISHSELFLLDSWGHLIWLGSGVEELDKKMADFLKR
jgi:pimeloyl-ACP methyl ester carboxylesterase